MTSDKTLLESKIYCDHKSPVTIPNGDYIPVEGKWYCDLPNGIKFGNVLYILSFKCNLISINRLTRELNYAVTFYPAFYLVQGLHENKLIGVGKCEGGLYRMGSVKE